MWDTFLGLVTVNLAWHRWDVLGRRVTCLLLQRQITLFNSLVGYISPGSSLVCHRVWFSLACPNLYQHRQHARKENLPQSMPITFTHLVQLVHLCTLCSSLIIWFGGHNGNKRHDNTCIIEQQNIIFEYIQVMLIHSIRASRPHNFISWHTWQCNWLRCVHCSFFFWLHLKKETYFSLGTTSHNNTSQTCVWEIMRGGGISLIFICCVNNISGGKWKWNIVSPNLPSSTLLINFYCILFCIMFPKGWDHL